MCSTIVTVMRRYLCVDIGVLVSCSLTGVYALLLLLLCVCVFFQAEDGIRYLVRSRGLGDVYKRQI